MIESPGVIITLLGFLAVIGPLIFVHELGHYFAGRACGVKADVFSIGFGREILGWTDRRGTRWRVGWLPMGGYVKFAGDMNPASTPSDEWLRMPPAERARTFQAKPLWQRFLIVAAGPLTNFAFAILLFCGLFAYLGGEPVTPPVVTQIVAGSAAEAAGIKVGDRVLELDGRRITKFEQIADIVMIRPGQAMDIALRRGGRELRLEVTPKPSVVRDRFGNEGNIGLLGVAASGTAIAPLRAWETVPAALRHTGGVIATTVEVLGQIVTGRRSAKEMGGPLKIAQFSGERVSTGWFDFIDFMALISINLGFINLLPVPMLDGGHLLFYLVEGVRRRPIAPRVQEWAFRSGLAVLLTLMLFVTFNDLGSFGLWKQLAGLIG